MEPTVLSSPTGENFAIPNESDTYYRLTVAHLSQFREQKFKPSEVMVYCYIKATDPFGQGFRFLPKQIAKILKYNHRTVTRAFKALTEAGALALAFVEAHVRVVDTAVETIPEIVAKLGTKDIPTPEEPNLVTSIESLAPEPPSIDPAIESIPTPPAPEQPLSPPKGKGFTSVANVIQNLNIPHPTASSPDDAAKTSQWYDRVEVRLNELDIQLKDVLHALKKYPVKAIEDALAHTQKQKWSNAKAGVFVNYLKKWTPNPTTAKNTSYPAPVPVVTALMKRFPESAGVLASEQNPIDEATLDYLGRLKANGAIYDTHYSTIHNFFGVFITVKDYPHPIPWWEAIERLQKLYPRCA
jgi:hypothetical protein